MEFVRIKNGDIVRHFKKETTDGSNPYQYLYRVVYEALYDNGEGVKVGDIFVRRYEEFMSEVDHVKYPNIKQKYRFETTSI